MGDPTCKDCSPERGAGDERIAKDEKSKSGKDTMTVTDADAGLVKEVTEVKGGEDG